jgi:ATP-dependent helicase HrpA
LVLNSLNAVNTANTIADAQANPLVETPRFRLPDGQKPLFDEAFLNFPENLPVSARRDEIAALIASHKVVIVCGETGSGKTTQLPKICTLAGCGRKGLIGHTQPRRLAATTVAKRIADELKSPIGTHVGYKIRFNEKFAVGAKFKLMTDGILLAETLSDPLLKSYDTIIIDEAHERSLNIDFLLGYLKQLLDGPRKDLKVIVTSATIDAQRFAEHFAFDGKPAPVIEVSGRLYPVEVRYVEPEQIASSQGDNRQDFDDEDDLPAQIEAAIELLWREKMGDVLVFLPGEREIREATDHFRRLTARQSSRNNGAFKGVFGRPGIEVLPLFSKLAANEQQLIFSQGQGTRIVLATNVAETSVTVPNIRYVVDTGTARVKRYRYRSKVEQLQIEPISQAAANQRAGRCGRVMDGICVRLYGEADFNARPKFTDPEILRSSLAAVILRMKALKLKAIEEFPFLELPSKKAIADGYALLHELDAVDERGAITPMGQQLSRLPLDPRVARMLLAARSNGCLDEVLIIASALSVQDPRERPMTAQQAADQQHKRFADEKSDFMSFVKLWNYWQDVQKQHGGSGQSKRSVANRMDREFISSKRLREWADVHSQLADAVGDLHWGKGKHAAEPSVNPLPVVQSEEKLLAAKADAISKSLLTGLLGNLGFNPVDESGYMGTHQVRFLIHPGSGLAKKPPRWVMAAELVETTRLYARAAAKVDAPWIEQAAQHLIQISYSEPHWEKQAGQVVAFERGILYGLLIYSQRKMNYGAKDQKLGRELMIRSALVLGDWESKLPFFEHNRRLIKEIEKLEHQIRRPDLLIDDELLYQWFSARVPETIWSAAMLTRWWTEASKQDEKLLFLDRDLLLKKDAGIDDRSFPKLLAMRGFQYRLEYKFEPSASDDGVTLILPIYALNQVDAERCEWLVPGMLTEKVSGLVKTLPPKWRRHFVPLAAYAEKFIDRTWAWKNDQEPPKKTLVQSLLNDFQEHEGLKLSATDFRFEALIAHSTMNYKLVDEHGATLAMSRNLSELRAQFGGRAQTTFQAALQKIKPASSAVMKPENDSALQTIRVGNSTPSPTNVNTKAVENNKIVKRAGERYTDWRFGELPELLEIDHEGSTLLGYPAIVDKTEGVEIAVFDEPEVAANHHRFGLSRLFSIAFKEQLKFFEKNIPDAVKLNMLFLPFGSADDLRQQLTFKLIDRACLQDPLPFSEASFVQRVTDAKPRLNLIGQEIARHLAAVLTDYAGLVKKLPAIRNEKTLAADIEAQLAELLPKKFLVNTESAQLQHMPRYLKAIAMRIDKYKADPARDAERTKEMAPMMNEYRRVLASRKGQPDAKLSEFGWLLQELRVSLFAQELRTPMPVSVKRLQKAWTGTF